MKKFIAFSGGVESSTMCVLFGNNADAIFADTGFEHKEIYDRINLIETWCKSFHRQDFKIHKIKNEKEKSLPDYIRKSNYYPNFQVRYCTRMFKIEPIDDFLEQYKDDGVELMIGLNADEIEQRKGNHSNKPFVNYSYPLADNGITRDMCKVVLRKVNLYPNFPPYMKRGGCIGCYFKSKKEYEALALLNPDEFNIVQKLEEDMQKWDNDRGNIDRSKYFSIIQGITMKELKKNAHNILFKPDEIYPTVNDTTNCGVFCNR